jgi:hypothetical protein
VNPQSFDPSRLSSYFRELAETSQPVSVSSTLPPELVTLCGPWVSATAAVAKASFALAGVKTAGPILDLALALSGIGDAQTELLKSIKADTELLRKKSLRSAIRWVRHAELVGPGDKDWAKYLDRAEQELVDADSVANSDEEKTVVCFALAGLYLTLDKPLLSQDLINESVTSKDRVLSGLLNTRNIKKGTEALGRFVPFSNNVDICAATIHGRTRVKVVGKGWSETELVDTKYGNIPLGTGKFHVAYEWLDLPARKSSGT